MSPDARPTVTVILPTYREEGAIGQTLDGLAAAMDQAGLTWEALVVDDASPDGTQDEVRTRQAALGAHIRLIVRTDERGLASAVVRGYREAKGTLLAVMDADGQHPPEAMVQMVRTALDEDADIVIGSRHTAGGSVGSFGPLRRLMSWGAGTMARIALPPVRRARITDPMSGLFLVHRDSVDAAHLSPRGYKVLLEVLAAARPRHGERPVVREVPYTFGARAAGESKLGGGVMVDYVLHLTALGMRDRENRRFVHFGLVGGSGIFVNMGLLALGGMMFGATGGLPFLINATISREGAVAWNFVLNDIFTFRDMRLATGYNRFIRFLRFNLVSLSSFVVYLAVAAGLKALGMHYLVAGFLAILLSVLINFKGNLEWTYESKTSRHTRRERKRRARLATPE